MPALGALLAFNLWSDFRAAGEYTREPYDQALADTRWRWPRTFNRTARASRSICRRRRRWRCTRTASTISTT